MQVIRFILVILSCNIYHVLSSDGRGFGDDYEWRGVDEYKDVINEEQKIGMVNLNHHKYIPGGMLLEQLNQ